MRLALSALVAVLLVGCSGTKVYEAQPYTNGQFIIYSKGKSIGDANAQSVEKATAFCAKDKKTMVPVTNATVARRQFEFIFTCNAA